MFGIKYIKFEPSVYVLKYKKGKIVKEGAGLSFNYYVRNTSIVTIPIGSAEAPFIFEEVTSDFQTITVQGQVTYRIIDHKKIAQILNYTFEPKTKSFVSDDPYKLSQRIINSVRVLIKKSVERMTLHEAIKASELVASDVFSEIKDISEMRLLGIEIMGFSVLSIKPNKETSRALEAQAREQILKNADEAIYERRNAAIEQERIIKENELSTEIAVEEKKKQIKEKQLEAQRTVQQKSNQLKEEQINFDTELESKKNDLVELVAKNLKVEADSKAYELESVIKVIEETDPAIIEALASIDMQPNKLIAMAFKGIADKADKIGQLNITPDLLQDLMKDKQ